MIAILLIFGENAVNDRVVDFPVVSRSLLACKESEKGADVSCEGRILHKVRINGFYQDFIDKFRFTPNLIIPLLETFDVDLIGS